MSIVPGSETTCVRCGARVVLYMKIQGGKYVKGNPKAYDWHCGTDPRYPTRGHKPRTLPGEDPKTMYIEFLVKVELERDEGKFASRDDLAGQIQDELAGADPGTLDGENGGTYSVNSWEVEEVEQQKGAKAK